MAGHRPRRGAQADRNRFPKHTVQHRPRGEKGRVTPSGPAHRPYIVQEIPFRETMEDDVTHFPDLCPEEPMKECRYGS